ncbi:MAG: diacylglycerol/lipid kinase family protein [Phocaeicola sp.]|uniref:diacylglycerol/lipid kinase family protein n=1 Tax=Phocaeicola TaxID=909656 RepID=UPI00234EAA6F|nr:diacylglycerol kinase family protein [Phocaeicola oris]MCE2616379.1 diacylglycerol kinase family lipid kinase [Phocaeicola oris]
MAEKKKIAFIVNPISGIQSKDAILKMIDELLDKEKYDYEIVKTEYAGHGTELATNAAKQNIDIAVAIGGDGTVNEVARGIVHSNTALGIIPCGSGNGLARALHISREPKAAIHILNKGKQLCIDYGKINEIPFFCTCGVGFDAFISMKFATAGKRGPMTYVQNILKQYLSYKPETYEVTTEDGTIRHKAFLITCANADQYGNNAYIAPQASMNDGLLDVTILEPFTVLDIGPLTFRLFNKTIDQDSRIKTFRTKKVTIHRATPGVFHVDGDPIEGDKELTIEIIPKGLNIITPDKETTPLSINPLTEIHNFFKGLQPLMNFTETSLKELKGKFPTPFDKNRESNS